MKECPQCSHGNRFRILQKQINNQEDNKPLYQWSNRIMRLFTTIFRKSNIARVVITIVSWLRMSWWRLLHKLIAKRTSLYNRRCQTEFNKQEQRAKYHYIQLTWWPWLEKVASVTPRTYRPWVMIWHFMLLIKSVWWYFHWNPI